MDTDAASAPFAFSGLDRLFHERARLGIVTSLAGQPEGLSFGELKRRVGRDAHQVRQLPACDVALIFRLFASQAAIA